VARSATIVRCSTERLGRRERELRSLFAAAWPDPDEAFDDDDWEHAIGGEHFLCVVDGRVRSHVSVVERTLEADGRPLRTGYVEAVATLPSDRGRGYAGSLLREATELIVGRDELGALGTDLFDFYRRWGWERWRGRLAVRTADGPVRTPSEEGFVMVRRTRATPAIDLGGLLTCEPRSGDVW
jgi:aminoglycoside 2'-N-acetyltransferase I